MNKFDWSDLDVKLLRLLVTVVHTGSITRAAQQLGVTQSAVSHLLDKLRAITADPLFVKSGRGIVATARALALAEQAQDLLTQLHGFVQTGVFEPAKLQQCITIAANDLQRDVLLPALLQQLQSQAPGVSLRVLPSDIPSAEMLRSGQCQLLLSPRPPEGSDIVHKRLFTDRYRVFYDASQRAAPDTAKAYLASEHVTVVYSAERGLDIDQTLSKQGVQRRFAVTVTSFAGIAAFIQGSNRLATLPGLLREGLLRGLADAPMPLKTPFMPMYAIWHLRHQQDPLHRWLRQQLFALKAPSSAP